jgi:uncharacterized protein
VAVSIVAGISEEAIYRGYLQRQFTALTQSVPSGVLFSSNFRRSTCGPGMVASRVIAISAILLGAVARWRGTVRPGIFAHGLQDAIAPLLLKLLRH